MPTNFSTLSGPERKWRPGQPLSNSDYLELLKERFWSKVDKTPGQGPKGDCWEFRGARDAKGYGSMACRLIKRTKRPVRTHRVSYFLAHGHLPKGKEVCHTCDNPPCCNPAHLYSGSHRQNMYEATSKGRMKPRGIPFTPQPTTRKEIIRRIALTPEQGKEIIAQRRLRKINIYKMAEWLGIHYTAYFFAEKGKRPLTLEHYHFVTRFLGLDEEALNINPNQFYDYAEQGTILGKGRLKVPLKKAA